MKAGMPGAVVLATDGSADAALARRAVADLARSSDTTVHVVSAWNLATATYGFPAGTIPYDVPSPYEEETKEVVAAGHRALEESGIHTVRDHVVCGRAADAILDVAGSVDAGLVVIGSRGQGVLGRMVLGSVSDAVVRQASLPVLVVRGGAEGWPPERIVAGHDGSEEAIAAIRLAALIAARIDAALTVVEAVPPLGERAARESDDSDVAVGDILEGRHGQLEVAVRDLVAPPPRDLEVTVEPGDPAATLLTAAARRSVMVAVGRRGIGRVREMFLGSVSTKILHGAPGAVLVVPHHRA